MSDELPAFGDSEPEDAWDIDDPVPELIENLRRRIILLGVIVTRFEDDAPEPEQLDELHAALDRARARRDLTPRDQMRIRDTAEDLATIRELIS